MDNSKKENLSKVVLNVTTYKPHPDNKDVECQQSTEIDITDLLAKYGINDVYPIEGVTYFETNGEERAFGTKFAISGTEMISLKRELSYIIDAAIVNDKQGKAIKKLIDERFDAFTKKHWEPISKCNLAAEFHNALIKQEAEE